jgi:hypothetical protein
MLTQIKKVLVSVLVSASLLIPAVGSANEIS